MGEKTSNPKSSSRVAIVTPVYRLPMLPDEEISLKHLREFLGNYERILILPKKLKIPPHLFPDFRQERFNDQYFTGIEGYNQLMLSNCFYRRFKDYDYILIYQLDCLVFSSDLLSWCDKGWDYVGAPWFPNIDNFRQGFRGVGNGGLSLRCVDAFLRVLRSKELVENPQARAAINARFKSNKLIRATYRFVLMKAYEIGFKNDIQWYLNKFNEEEDLFWAFHSHKFTDRFLIPSPEEALKFSFEWAPEFCFKLNKDKLPFGCHAWRKCGEKFWEPYILK